jgi:hypothetical protein
MKKDIVSIIINLIVLAFLFATFFLQYEYLFVTRIVLIVFAIVYLVINIKKEYFSANKIVFILFSVVSIIALVVSISFDNTSASGVTNDRNFFIPFYVFILIVIMYKDLYAKNK